MPPLVLCIHWYCNTAEPDEVGVTVNTALVPAQTVCPATVAAVTEFTRSVPAVEVNAAQPVGVTMHSYWLLSAEAAGADTV